MSFVCEEESIEESKSRIKIFIGEYEIFIRIHASNQDFDEKFNETYLEYVLLKNKCICILVSGGNRTNVLIKRVPDIRYVV